jgi:hypothetical protein
MYSERQFFALEVMCRERATSATKEMEYWLAEAEEWARFRQSCSEGGKRSVYSLVPTSGDRPFGIP